MIINHTTSNTLSSIHYKFVSLCLLIILLAMTVTDLPVQLMLGTLGASPVWIVSTIIFLFFLITNKFYLYLDNYSRLFLNYFLLSFSISLIQCVWYFVSEGTMSNTFGGSVFNKLFFAASYYLFYFLTLYCVNRAMYMVRGSTFKKSIIAVALFLIIIVVIEHFAPQMLAPLHLTMDGYGEGGRQRLLSPEPSIAAFTFNIFLLLSLTLSSSNLLRVILWCALLVGNILIGSKSSLVLIMFGASLVFYFNMSLIQKLKSLIILIPVAVGVVYIFLISVLPALNADIENFTSVSTRLITSLWALCSLIYYPLGEGYGTYTAYFVAPMDMAITVAKNLVPFTLNLTEIDHMVTTGEFLSAKSGILVSFIHSGLLAVIFYFVIFRNAFRDVRASKAKYYQKTLMRVTLWYSLLSILLAVNMEILYTFLLPFVAVSYLKKNYEQ